MTDERKQQWDKLFKATVIVIGAVVSLCGLLFTFGQQVQGIKDTIMATDIASQQRDQQQIKRIDEVAADVNEIKQQIVLQNKSEEDWREGVREALAKIPDRYTGTDYVTMTFIYNSQHPKILLPSLGEIRRQEMGMNGQGKNPTVEINP